MRHSIGITVYLTKNIICMERNFYLLGQEHQEHLLVLIYGEDKKQY